MSQISHIFSSEKIFITSKELSENLMSQVMNYTTKNNLEIVTISHFCSWSQHDFGFYGHIIVIFKKLENTNLCDIKSVKLLEF
jgi:hypothetical protein